MTKSTSPVSSKRVRWSLGARLSIVASLLLVLCLIAIGFLLEALHRTSAERALKERLEVHLYGLAAVTDVDIDGSILMPDELRDARFSNPESGLYGFVRSQAKLQWESGSAVGLSVVLPESNTLGKIAYINTQAEQKPLMVALLSLEYIIEDENGGDKSIPLDLLIAEDLSSHQAALMSYRQNLAFGSLIVTLIFVFAQFFVLRYVLRPLRDVADEVKQLETGERHELDGDYPNELRGLTRNLNALMENERQNLERYRNALGDLAHSLKTPLAVMRNEFDPQQDSHLYQQTQRMQEIIDYHLQRAAAAGRMTVGEAIDAAAVVGRVSEMLKKVYANKGTQINQLPDELELPFRGDEGDLMEVVGNLLDNACKYGKQHVRVSGEYRKEQRQMVLLIEDDGNGVPESLADDVMKRGKRLQVDLPGQGLGLHLVQDIVRLYGGELNFKQSDLGGAKVELVLPA